MSKTGSKHEPLSLPEGNEYTHRAHRFPGKFHPPLIKHILKEFGDNHDTVADPMCGSGTLGVEGSVLGKDVLCIDLDPLACLMTRAKTTPVEPEKLNLVGSNILRQTPPMPSEGDFSEEAARDIVEKNLSGTDFCIPLNFFHWFEPYVAVGYSNLLNTANSVLENERSDVDDAVRTVLAAMVRRISRADPQPVSGLEVTSVRQKELENGLTFDVERTFRECLNRMLDGYKELLQENIDLGDVEVQRGDAKSFAELCTQADRRPSMVVTSPPYCNAIEYTRRHRLEYEWLGLFNSDNVDDHRQNRINTSRDFIGSTTPTQDMLQSLPPVPHDDIEGLMKTISVENERKANLLRKYFHDAYDWLEEIYKALPEGGLFCLIIGPSTSYDNTIDTPQFLTDIATNSKAGGFAFKKVEERPYKLKNNKMQYPTDGTTTEIEKLIRLEK